MLLVILALLIQGHLLTQDSDPQSGLLRFPYLLEFEVEQLLQNDLSIFSIEAWYVNGYRNHILDRMIS